MEIRSDNQRENAVEIRANYIIVGAFTLAVLFGGFIFTLWSAKSSKDVLLAYYDISFNESVKGLSVGNDVLFTGIRVGAVTGIRISQTTPGAVTVRVGIDAETPVREDSEAKLELQGLTGISVISISGGTAGSPLSRPAEGKAGTIRYTPSPLTAVVNRVPETLANVNALLRRLELVLSDENIAHINNTVASLDKITAALANRADSIDAILTHAEKTSRDLQVLVGKAGDDLLATGEALGRAARRADETMKSLEPGMKQFSREGLSELRMLLVEARNLMHVLTRVGQKLENDPRRFLFGDPVQEYQSR